MINLFRSGLCALLLLSGCGWDNAPTRATDFVQPTSITISGVSSTIAKDSSIKLTATGHYSGVFTRDVTDQVVWTSASPAVAEFRYATAPNKNRVTAVAPGTVVVTATMGSVSGTYPLTVSNAVIQTLTVTPAAPAALPKGRTTQFAVSGTFLDGTVTTVQDLAFDADWSSSDITVVTVSNGPADKGLAKAVAASGSATISATFPSTGGAGSVIGTKLLAVTAPALDSIMIAPADASIAGFSKTVNFVATGNFSDGTTADITTTAAWSSSAPSIATIIAGSGTATTVAAGTTIISATRDGVTGSTNLTVTAPVLIANGLQLTPANPAVAVGATQQLTVTATFNDGSTQNVTASCTWSSSAPTRASVNTAGLVTGASTGSATITASYGGQSVATTVTVP